MVVQLQPSTSDEKPIKASPKKKKSKKTRLPEPDQLALINVDKEETEPAINVVIKDEGAESFATPVAATEPEEGTGEAGAESPRKGGAGDSPFRPVEPKPARSPKKKRKNKEKYQV